MHPSHIQYKKCRLEFLQGIMNEISINKSEMEIYLIIIKSKSLLQYVMSLKALS